MTRDHADAGGVAGMTRVVDGVGANGVDGILDRHDRGGGH